MRVLVDAVQLTEHVTGSDRLARNVLRELGSASDHEWAVLVHDRFDGVREQLGRTMTAVPVAGRMRARWYASELRRHARAHDSDVVLSFYNCVGPLAAAPPSVVSVLDLIPFHFDQGYFEDARTRTLVRFLQRRAARRATRLVAISRHGRQDAVDTLGVAPARVAVATLQADPRFEVPSPAQRASARAALDLPPSYVLAVGANEPRKNVTRLIAAHRSLPDDLRTAFPLVIMGPPYAGSDAIDADAHVRSLGFVPEEHLQAVYAESTVFAFVSVYEGFGLPVLEAQACGAAVLLSSATSLPEVGGESVTYVDPHDVVSIADGLQGLLSDAGRRSELVRLGASNVGRFSWSKAAEVYLDAVERAGGQRT